MHFSLTIPPKIQPSLTTSEIAGVNPRFFSIIIPLYNRPQEIEELLSSLCEQNYTHFEVVIVEDGSVLKGDEVVNKYHSELSIQYHYKENSGQGFSRNVGFELAKGDYFIVLDSDVLLPKSYLETVNNSLNMHWLDCFGGPDAAHSSFTKIQKAISYSMTSPFTTGGIRGGKKHIGQFHPRSFNMGISREVWEKTGGFTLTRLGEDIEFSIRIHSNGFKIGLIPEAVVYHKRRTDFKQFYKQLHFFGRARINIFKHFPSELKLVHFFPALFTLFLFSIPIQFMVNTQLGFLSLFLFWLYSLTIFVHAAFKNGSARIGFLSVGAAYIQLTAYGIGFLTDFLKRVILNK